VQQAIDRGELPGDTDPHEVIRAVSAPLYYRLLNSGEPLDAAAAERAARAAACAAEAGAYRRPGPGAGTVTRTGSPSGAAGQVP
jgi:hypothetical protein